VGRELQAAATPQEFILNWFVYIRNAPKTENAISREIS